ncbi:MAG: hypothetical protein WCJ18_05625, partial [Planctomycetota bacterium]
PIACRRSPGQDDSPLPRGARVEPDIEPELARSRIRVPIRFTLPSIQRLVRALAPRKLDRQSLGFDGVVELGELEVAATDKEELVVTGTGDFSGTVAMFGQLEIKTMRFNIDGTRARFALAPDLSLRLDVDAEAAIESWKPKSVVPREWLRKGANYLGTLEQRLQSTLSQIQIPTAMLALAAVRMVDGEVAVRCDPARPIVSRVESSFISRPQITPGSGDLTLTIGLDMHAEVGSRSVVTDGIDSEPQPPTVVDAGSLSTVSEFNLPIVIDVNELSRLWKPVSVHVPYGTCRVERSQFSEQGGQLYMKTVIAVEPQEGWASMLLRQSEAVVLLSCRPSCNEKTGRLTLEELAFTAKSDSLMVEWLGSAARPILLAAIQQAVPSLIDSVVLRTQNWVNDSAQGYVHVMIEELSQEKTGFQEIMRDVRPSVESCSLRVDHVRLADGFLTAGVHGTAVLGVAWQ